MSGWKFEYRMVVEYPNEYVPDPDDDYYIDDEVRAKRYRKPTRAKALIDGDDLRRAIAALEMAGNGCGAKQWFRTKGTWSLALYWKGATVIVEERGIGAWNPIHEERRNRMNELTKTAGYTEEHRLWSELVGIIERVGLYVVDWQWADSDQAGMVYSEGMAGFQAVSRYGLRDDMTVLLMTLTSAVDGEYMATEAGGQMEKSFAPEELEDVVVALREWVVATWDAPEVATS